MYVHIDDGIEDDECKVMFKHELQKGMKKLVENIKSGLKKMGNNLVKIQKKILDNLKRGLKIF